MSNELIERINSALYEDGDLLIATGLLAEAVQAIADLTTENEQLRERIRLVMQLDSGDYGSEAAIMLSGIQITLGHAAALKGE